MTAFHDALTHEVKIEWLRKAKAELFAGHLAAIDQDALKQRLIQQAAYPGVGFGVGLTAPSD